MMRSLIILITMFIFLPGYGQIEKSHQLTVILENNDYYRMHRLWNKMVIEQNGKKKIENILPSQEKYIIKDLKPGNCLITFCSVFGDVCDTSLCFDKRIGLTLKYELTNYQVNQVSIDSLFAARFSENDTLYIYYNVEGCFGGNDQGLVTLIRDKQNLYAILDDKIHDSNSKIIESRISPEILAEIIAFEHMLMYSTTASNECTSVTYYTLYKDGKVKFGKDGTCSKYGIEALKEKIFDKK